jgi:GMP synthase (glutamine-hydrolysing)
MQLLADHFKGEVSASHAGEYGYAKLTRLAKSALWHQNFSEVEDVWMSHGDRVSRLPDGFCAIARTDDLEIAAMSCEARKLYGIQFHPEVTHTNNGLALLESFVCQVCACETLWKVETIAETLIEQLKERIGDDQVILGLSGGVDSSVVALLLDKAIGPQLTCIFVDTGLLRHREADEVMATFREHFKLNVVLVDAKEVFLKSLAGISCPEAKRKIIGGKFIDVFEQEAEKLNGVRWLAQGTIYPDVIESSKASQSSQVIKSHHNVGGLPDRLNFKLIEPLRELFKDEVRRLGAYLGLEKSLLNRHPFPGPGLGVRILGEIKKEFIEILQQADHIFLQALVNEGFYQKTSQAFAVFLPVKSVGVMGDARRYEYVIALRAVETSDFMTANWAELPHSFLNEVSTKIINQVPGVSRVVYDISGKPPATIEWE